MKFTNRDNRIENVSKNFYNYGSSEKYWKKKTKLVKWKKIPKDIIKKNFFFNDGKINIAYNCIKANIDKGLGNKIAVYLIDKNEKEIFLTYRELNNLVNHFISFLKKNYSKSDLYSDIISIHSSANLCSIISMLALTKMGITHSVFFNDLSHEAIKLRIKLLNSKIIISSTNNDDFVNKILNIKKIKKIKFSEESYSNKKIKNLNFYDFYKKKNFDTYKHDYTFVKSNHPSFVLFTSGTTGAPKGIIHSTGGYLLYSKYTCLKQFGMSKNSVVLTASDAGWINGHTYALYGPLSIGATTILLERPLSLLSDNLMKRILNKYKVSILYLPVTLIRMIKATSNKKFKSIYLKTLGSMGEPLSKNVAKWFSKAFSVKALQVVNTYFQTETGGIISSPRYNDNFSKVPLGTVGKPINKYLGVYLENKNLEKSEIKIKYLWPGALIGVINGDKYFKNYWDKNNCFKLFDYASLDNNKNYLIHGRLDDVINIRGHRIGSAEIESVLLKVSDLIECGAIGVEDSLEGQVLIIFYSSIDNKSLNNIINSELIKKFGTFAVPRQIIKLPEIPKTRSGKILRRLLRDLYKNPKKIKLGDTSTILNKSLINKIRNIILLKVKS